MKIDPDSGTPIYLQIIDELKTAVLSGRYRDGDRVLPVRELAVQLLCLAVVSSGPVDRRVRIGDACRRKGFRKLLGGFLRPQKQHSVCRGQIRYPFLRHI